MDFATNFIIPVFLYSKPKKNGGFGFCSGL